MGRTTRDLNPLHFATLGKGAVEIYKEVDPWLSSWWIISLSFPGKIDWFGEYKIGDNLIWAPYPEAI